MSTLSSSSSSLGQVTTTVPSIGREIVNHHVVMSGRRVHHSASSSSSSSMSCPKESTLTSSVGRSATTQITKSVGDPSVPTLHAALALFDRFRSQAYEQPEIELRVLSFSRGTEVQPDHFYEEIRPYASEVERTAWVARVRMIQRFRESPHHLLPSLSIVPTQPDQKQSWYLGRWHKMDQNALWCQHTITSRTVEYRPGQLELVSGSSDSPRGENLPAFAKPYATYTSELCRAKVDTYEPLTSYSLHVLEGRGDITEALDGVIHPEVRARASVVLEAFLEDQQSLRIVMVFMEPDSNSYTKRIFSKVNTGTGEETKIIDLTKDMKALSMS